MFPSTSAKTPALRSLFSSRLVKAVLSQSYWGTGAAGRTEAEVAVFAALAVPVLELGAVSPLFFAMAAVLGSSGCFCGNLELVKKVQSGGRG